MDWIMIFTGVVAASTAVYAYLTYKLVAETRRLRQLQTEPRVTIRVDEDHIGHRRLDLIVRNEGQGLAKNVRFEFRGDSSYFRSSFIGTNAPPEIPNLPIFQNGLDYLEPRQEYKFPLGTPTVEESGRAARSPWQFRITCEDIDGTLHVEQCTIDFSLLKGMIFTPNYLKDIAGHLKEVSDHIASRE